MRQWIAKIWDWFLFGGIVIISVLVLLMLPPEKSSLWFAALIVGTLLVTLIEQRGTAWIFVMLHRRAVASGLALLAVIAMALSAYFFRPMPESLIHYRPTKGPKVHYRAPAPWFFLFGGIALSLALGFSRRSVRRWGKPARSRLKSGDAQVLPLVAGMLMLFALAEINGGLVGIDALKNISHHVQFALLVAGIGLVVWGLAGIGWPGRRWVMRQSVRLRDRIRSRNTASPPRPPSPAELERGESGHGSVRAIPWREVGLVLLLTGAALAVRFWQLGTSVRVLVDEVHFAFGATYFWRYADVRLLEPMQTTASFPFIYSYGISEMAGWLGRNFWGLRAFSAILGALTIPAIYLLARALYDRVTAVVAALVLITFPPHVHYSRLALNNIADPLFGTLGLAFLARGWRTNRRLDYALGGAMLGLSQYFYEGGRLLFPLLAAVWLGVGVIVWRARPSIQGLIIAALAFVLVALPVYYTLAGLDFPVIDRLDKTTMDAGYWNRDREPDNWQTRLVHFRHSLMMYVNSPENTLVYYYLYYGGRHPLVLEWLVPALLLGAVIAVWRWRGPGILPVGWVLATSIGNAALVESGVTARYVVAFPALALLIAVGIRYTLPLLWPPVLPVRWRNAIMVLLALGVALGQGYYYFGPFLDLFEFEVRYHVEQDVEDALLRALDYPPGTQIHIISKKALPDADARRFLQYLADDLSVEVIQPGSRTDAEWVALSRDVDHLFFVAPDDLFTQATLRELFDLEQSATTLYDVPAGKAFLMYHLPADPNAPPIPYVPGPEHAVG